MKALVIGGTRFVGAAIVDALLEAGAEVAVLSRGQTGAVAEGATHVRGDRAAIAELVTNTVDVVVDTCGYRPAEVELAATHLRDRAGRYLFVSTASVYADLESAGATVTEDHALATLEGDPTDGANYGPLKVLCERAVLDAYGDRATVLRPSLIVGPRDYTDRFPYWPARLARGGDVLVPGDGADPTQIVDARDLARFAVRLASDGVGGVFNVSGPAAAKTFADLIEACRGDAPCALHWAPPDYLEAHGVQPWSDMPVWLGRAHPDGAIMRLDLRRALAAGLEHRPWRQTAADTLAWFATTEREWPLRAGLSSEREASLVAGLR